MYFGVSKNDPWYPTLLSKLSDAPDNLYYKGRWDDSIFENCLAVVGSRRMTTYGHMVTDKFVYEVASSGITIVSGFMYGVDATAHEAAINAGGKTIAVMPCGIETISPPNQADLYKSLIESGGLVISEYSGDSQPQLWTYPKRNRIVAGLCKAVLVIEAAEDSGSLITAELAKSFGRSVLAVPGSIFSGNSEGTLKLISEGAKIVRTAKDIIEIFKPEVGLPLFSYSHKRDKLLETISLEPVTLDELAEKLGKPAGLLGAEVSAYLLSGHVFERGGRYYVDKG